MKFKTLSLLTVNLLLTLIFSCNYRVDKTNSANSILSEKTEISYDTIKNYSLSSCLHCHAGGQAPNLSTLSNLKLNETLIAGELDTASMPPAGSGYDLLTACQKDLYKHWVQLGYPETSTHSVSEVASCRGVFDPSPTPTPVADPSILLMPLNYQTLNKKILQPKCLMCHSAGGSAPDKSFYPYSQVLGSKLWAAPGINSTVYDEITTQGMPTPESGLAPLTKDEIQFVKNWIDAGKPEN